ncbi:hypothetical protein MNBD_GAMMA08-280 [hydrothermal vent metagenome]|uniref:Phytase-like domain-containing protein n=1 Tax=hydrothermal vent metagenome TaxID=652676 RepID=A0A3B0WUN8_9ZZZZ
MIKIKKNILTLSFFSIALMTLTSQALNADSFENIDVFSINNSDKFNLSGLDVCNDKLLTVSDKKDDYIYEIKISKNQAYLIKNKYVEAPKHSASGYFTLHKIIYFAESLILGDFNDWEGISCYENDIYLVSERKNSILHISDANTDWLPVEFYKSGVKEEYFNSYNASIEGIAVVNKNEIFLMIERNPRGTAHITQSNNELWDVEFNSLKNLGLNYINNSYDVAGVAVYGEYMYTLERNAYAVCKRKLYNTSEGNCLSYEHIALDKNNTYSDEEYGLGEGIAIDEKYIYIVFDNNNSHKYKDSTDYRSILLRIAHPKSWE